MRPLLCWVSVGVAGLWGTDRATKLGLAWLSRSPEQVATEFCSTIGVPLPWDQTSGTRTGFRARGRAGSFCISRRQMSTRWIAEGDLSYRQRTVKLGGLRGQPDQQEWNKMVYLYYGWIGSTGLHTIRSSTASSPAWIYFFCEAPFFGFGRPGRWMAHQGLYLEKPRSFTMGQRPWMAGVAIVFV